jgi:hypothetical protein
VFDDWADFGASWSEDELLIIATPAFGSAGGVYDGSLLISGGIV